MYLIFQTCQRPSSVPSPLSPLSPLLLRVLVMGREVDRETAALWQGAVSLLGFDPSVLELGEPLDADWGFQTLSSTNTPQQSAQRTLHHVLHFLLVKARPKEATDIFRDCFPPRDRIEMTAFRTAVSECLHRLMKEGLLDRPLHGNYRPTSFQPPFPAVSTLHALLAELSVLAMTTTLRQHYKETVTSFPRDTDLSLNEKRMAIQAAQLHEVRHMRDFLSVAEEMTAAHEAWKKSAQMIHVAWNGEQHESSPTHADLEILAPAAEEKRAAGLDQLRKHRATLQTNIHEHRADREVLEALVGDEASQQRIDGKTIHPVGSDTLDCSHLVASFNQSLDEIHRAVVKDKQTIAGVEHLTSTLAPSVATHLATSRKLLLEGTVLVEELGKQVQDVQATCHRLRQEVLPLAKSRAKKVLAPTTPCDYSFLSTWAKKSERDDYQRVHVPGPDSVNRLLYSIRAAANAHGKHVRRGMAGQLLKETKYSSPTCCSDLSPRPQPQPHPLGGGGPRRALLPKLAPPKPIIPVPDAVDQMVNRVICPPSTPPQYHLPDIAMDSPSLDELVASGGGGGTSQEDVFDLLHDPLQLPDEKE